MRRAQLALALRYLVIVMVVIGMAAASSGALWPGAWNRLVSVDSAAARALSDYDRSQHYAGDVADNGPVCDLRPGPRVQTALDAAGRLQVTISAASDVQSFPIRLREIRIGPMQNAAVDAGSFTARTTPFVVSTAGNTQGSLRVTRIVADQPSHVTLVIMDDCGDWQTFVGGGTGVALAPPSATATPVTVAPGQPFGSIPISLSVTGSSSQYPPGSRPRVQITTRPNAACNLSVTWPDGRVDTEPARPATALGICEFRPTVPLGMPSGTATATGTVQDLFGLSRQQQSFQVGGSLTTIPPGDNITGTFDDEIWDDVDNREGDNADNLD